MKAFYGKQELKDKYVKQLGKNLTQRYFIGSYLLDDIVEDLFNIPRTITLLARSLLERSPEKETEDFSLNWLKAIKVNSDLSLVFPKFMFWLLVNKQHGVINFLLKGEETTQNIKKIAALFEKQINGKTVTSKEFFKAAKSVTKPGAFSAWATDTAVYAAKAAANTASIPLYRTQDTFYALHLAVEAIKYATNGPFNDSIYKAIARAARARQAAKFIELIKTA